MELVLIWGFFKLLLPFHMRISIGVVVVGHFKSVIYLKKKPT